MPVATPHPDEQRRRDLFLLRRVRDRIDREFARPLNVPALAAGVHVSAGHLGTFSTRFAELVGVSPSVYRRESRDATRGLPACVAKQVTRPVRNREATRTRPALSSPS